MVAPAEQAKCRASRDADMIGADMASRTRRVRLAPARPAVEDHRRDHSVRVCDTSAASHFPRYRSGCDWRLGLAGCVELPTMQRLIAWEAPTVRRHAADRDPGAIRGLHPRIGVRAPPGSIVAKWARGTYQSGGRTSWLKIKNPTYSQMEGRHDLFEARQSPMRPRRNRQPLSLVLA